MVSILQDSGVILNIQLVVADIDGTFTHSLHEPAAGALDAVRALREGGIAFTFCSGRGDPGIRPFVEMAALDLPYIVSAGAAIRNPRDQSVIFQQVMTADQVSALLRLGIASNSNIILHTPTRMYVLAPDSFWQEVCQRIWIQQGGWKNIFRCASASDVPTEPVIHIHLFNRDEVLPPLAEQVNALPLNLHANNVVSKLEVVDRTVNKGHALARLADHLHIPLANILAIGDDVNDISMLNAAGIGVAMGNSPAQVIRQAGYVAPANDRGGFAATIHHLLAGTLDQLKTT